MMITIDFITAIILIVAVVTPFVLWYIVNAKKYDELVRRYNDLEIKNEESQNKLEEQYK